MKLLGDPWKLIASLLVLQLRDLICIYICHNVYLAKKKSIGDLTCFIKLFLHSHNQIGDSIIVILATSLAYFRHHIGGNVLSLSAFHTSILSATLVTVENKVAFSLMAIAMWLRVIYRAKWKGAELTDLSESFGNYKSLASF